MDSAQEQAATPTKPAKRTAKLTEKLVAREPSPPRGLNGQVVQEDIWDTETSGLGLRVSSAGSKTWIVGLRVAKGGKTHYARVTLGRWPSMSLDDARQAATRAKLGEREHIDPREARKTERAKRLDESTQTFGVLVKRFLSKHVQGHGLRATTARDYRHTLQGDDVKEWDSLPVSRIEWEAVRDKLDAVKKRAPYAARHLFSHLRRFFNWLAFEERTLTASPMQGMKPITRAKKRERSLASDQLQDELREIWRAADAMQAKRLKPVPRDLRKPHSDHRPRGDLWGALFKLLVLTGQRREEVAGMRWDELTLTGPAPIWDLSPERTKNHKRHVVPLAPLAVSIISKLPRVVGSPFVFTTGISRGKEPTHVSGFSKAKAILDTEIRAARETAGVQGPEPDFVIHDIRHSFSTLMHDKLKVLPHIVEAIINHVSGFRAGVAGTYNHAEYLDERREALKKWASWVGKLVSQKT